MATVILLSSESPLTTAALTNYIDIQELPETGQFVEFAKKLQPDFSEIIVSCLTSLKPGQTPGGLTGYCTPMVSFVEALETNFSDRPVTVRQERDISTIHILSDISTIHILNTTHHIGYTITQGPQVRILVPQSSALQDVGSISLRPEEVLIWTPKKGQNVCAASSEHPNKITTLSAYQNTL